jgi:hypothetical protein
LNGIRQLNVGNDWACSVLWQYSAYWKVKIQTLGKSLFMKEVYCLLSVANLKFMAILVQDTCDGEY